MNVYTVRILDTVFADIGDIANYIVAVSTPEHAAKMQWTALRKKEDGTTVTQTMTWVKVN